MICVRVGGGSGCAGRCARTPAIGEDFELIGGECWREVAY